MQDKKYQGFGAEHTVEEWAKMLNVRTGVVRYLFEEKQVPPERLAECVNVMYNPGALNRKPREGARMAETRQLVEELLTRSGFTVYPCSVTVKIAYKTYHSVFFEGHRIGKYNYATGWLFDLYRASALPLKAHYSEDLKIQEAPNGFWEPTPDSQTIISRYELNIGEEPTAEKYAEILRKHEKAPAEPRGVLYEYKGREATCAEWARRLGVPQTTLRRHLNNGLTVEEALERFNAP